MGAPSVHDVETMEVRPEAQIASFHLGAVDPEKARPQNLRTIGKARRR
jgi:hypothetical protein